MVDVEQMKRRRPEQVTANESHHVGRTPAAPPQVEDEGVCVRERLQSCPQGVAGEFWGHELQHLQVTHVPGQNFDSRESEIRVPQTTAACLGGLGIRTFDRLWILAWPDLDPEVPV